MSLVQCPQCGRGYEVPAAGLEISRYWAAFGAHSVPLEEGRSSMPYDKYLEGCMVAGEDLCPDCAARAVGWCEESTDDSHERKHRELQRRYRRFWWLAFSLAVSCLLVLWLVDVLRGTH